MLTDTHIVSQTHCTLIQHTMHSVGAMAVCTHGQLKPLTSHSSRQMAWV